MKGPICSRKCLPDPSDLSRCLITRGASIQFAVVDRGPDVRERLIHLHKKALSLRSNNQLDLKAGIFIVSNPQISPLPLRIMPKQPVPISKKDYQAVYREYDEDLQKHLAIDHYVVTHLEEALKNHDIKVFFQPIIRTLTCKACAAEAWLVGMTPSMAICCLYLHQTA